MVRSEQIRACDSDLGPFSVSIMAELTRVLRGMVKTKWRYSYPAVMRNTQNF
jgi:hypothetical protein